MRLVGTNFYPSNPLFLYGFANKAIDLLYKLPLPKLKEYKHKPLNAYFLKYRGSKVYKVNFVKFVIVIYV